MSEPSPEPSPEPSTPSSATVNAVFARLLAELQGPLVGFVRGLTGNDEQARDTVQDVFVDAWRAARRDAAPFDGASDDAGMRRWLFHAAYLRAAGLARRARIIRWEPLDTMMPSGATDYPTSARPLEDQIVDAQVLRDALACLAPEDAGCVLLNVVYGFTAWEIARIIGITPEAAKKRVSRAKLRLRTAYFAQNPAPEKGTHA